MDRTRAGVLASSQTVHPWAGESPENTRVPGIALPLGLFKSQDKEHPAKQYNVAVGFQNLDYGEGEGMWVNSGLFKQNIWFYISCIDMQDACAQ